MEINADFSRRVAVHAARLPWVPSPMAGVERCMLDRIGDEVARATSIVRYAAGSRFSPTLMAITLDTSGGAELLVLQGGFDEGSEHFEPLSWLRLPTSSMLQAAAGPQGCRLWIKTGHLRTIRGDGLKGG
ncbi:MAG TPA: cupin domain-containing protein [Reyranella sp.]|nr:cupin domain-containing protein [Reyranella sp.]